jgi:hypothetical protein
MSAGTANLTTDILWFPSVPLEKCRNNTLNLATTASLQILFNPLFTFHPIIQRYTELVTTLLNQEKMDKYQDSYILAIAKCNELGITYHCGVFS